MGLDKKVWETVNSSGLKKKLKNCRTTICECIQEFLENGMNDPHHGLPNRFSRMLADNAVSSGIEAHKTQIEAQQRGMQEALRMYDDNGCPPGGKPARVDEYARMAPPTQADWEAKHGRPMPEYSTMQRIGWGAVGVAGIVATGVAILSPFDGPFGDVAAGAGTAAAWSRAFNLGRTLSTAF